MFDANGVNLLSISDTTELHNKETSKIKKIVYDLSHRQEGKRLGELGFILKKDGKKCSHNVLALGYTCKSQEVIVFRKIPQSDIAVILRPVAIDLLYSIAKLEKRDVFTNFLELLIEKESEIIKVASNSITEDYRQIFNDLYENNYNCMR